MKLVEDSDSALQEYEQQINEMANMLEASSQHTSDKVLAYVLSELVTQLQVASEVYIPRGILEKVREELYYMNETITMVNERT